MNIILDVDTGVDDAFALLFAARSPLVNLIGITCVDGNTNLDNVVANTLTVLDAAGAGDIPVARGAARPLIELPSYAEFVHGSDGMVEMQSKDSKRTLDPRSAIELMRDLINASSEPVTLVPIGPLTNIALFLRAFPDAANKLERIVLMGGSASVGNATATAEFNIWHDPEAAAVVFTSGVPITMYGLDVFTDLQMTPDDAKDLIAKGDKTSLFAGTLVDRFIKQMGHDVTLGDYGAVATAIAPHLAHTKSLRVVVDTTHGPNRGQTVCDHRPYADIAPESAHTNAPKVDVVLEIDIKAMKDMWLKTITGN